jgi:hypothetical protein
MSDYPIGPAIRTLQHVERNTPMSRIPSEAHLWEEERNKLDAEIERLKGRIGTLEEVLRETLNGLVQLNAIEKVQAKAQGQLIEDWQTEIKRTLKDER